MIVKMSRVYVAARQADRDRLLDRLAQMNLLHIEPVKPEEAVADEDAEGGEDGPGEGRDRLKVREKDHGGLRFEQAMIPIPGF